LLQKKQKLIVLKDKKRIVLIGLLFVAVILLMLPESKDSKKMTYLYPEKFARCRHVGHWVGTGEKENFFQMCLWK